MAEAELHQSHHQRSRPHHRRMYRPVGGHGVPDAALVREGVPHEEYRVG